MVDSIIIRFKPMKVQDNSWKLQCLQEWNLQCKRSNSELLGIKISDDLDQTFQASSECQNEVTHFVRPGETLYGISLRYGVEIDAIKRRNGLETDQIYYIRQLLITNPRPKVHQIKQISREEKVREVMNELKLCRDQQKLAQRILQQSSWDVEKSIKKYRADIQWQKEYAPIIGKIVKMVIKQ